MKAFKLNISFGYDSSFLTRINWTPFLAGLIIGVLAATLSQLGLIPSKLLSPLPMRYEIFDTVKPKLKQRVDNFRLQKQTQIIQPVSAGTQYDEASAYALIDYDTGEIIADKSLSDRLPIASLTKVMTAMVALDLAEPNELFTIRREAAHIIPTKIGVIPGQKMTLKELLQASLMTSANDATEAIRDGVDEKYKEPIFIRAMNEKAAIIGLKNTHFANPQGFDNPDHYSSTEDLALLTHYALTNYPLISEIVKKDYAFIEANQYHKQFDLYNWNGLIGVYPNVMGVKIGNTDEAGVTTIVLSEREGKRILAVVLGAPDILKRDMWTASLLDLGFEKTKQLKPIDVTETDLAAKYATWKTWN